MSNNKKYFEKLSKKMQKVDVHLVKVRTLYIKTPLLKKNYFFSFVLAFSTFIKRTKIFVFHSSFIRKNGKKCPSLREKSFCFSKSFFPTLKEKSFCLAKAFFLWQKDFSFRVGKKFLPKLKIL